MVKIKGESHSEAPTHSFLSIYIHDHDFQKKKNSLLTQNTKH
jgi:hypothetical protein